MTSITLKDDAHHNEWEAFLVISTGLKQIKRRDLALSEANTGNHAFQNQNCIDIQSINE
jgi:hypothetical protein